jgi:hypothetical protein
MTINDRRTTDDRMGRWMRWQCGAVAIAVCILTQTPSKAVGQAEAPPEVVDGDSAVTDNVGRFNIPLPTMGGKQLWTDHRWWYGWRIQHNLMTDHWRVLDEKNIRRGWGSREACIEILQRQIDSTSQASIGDQPTQQEPPRHVVILVHGLMRTGDSMDELAARLRVEHECLPIAFSYASTRASVSNHAAAMREWVENLPGSPTISIVGHSLGNIVSRHAIADWMQPDGDPKDVIARLDRFVMLGPPNQGSSIAKRLSKLGLFEIITGNSGKELGVAWDELQQHLAVPPCPFAIVAGDVSASAIQNPLIAKEGDFVVTLEETQLPGVAESLSVPVLHSFLMSDPEVVSATIRFLRHEPLVPSP